MEGMEKVLTALMPLSDFFNGKECDMIHRDTTDPHNEMIMSVRLFII